MIRYGREHPSRLSKILINKENIDMNDGERLKEKNHHQKYMDKLRMIKKVSDATTISSQTKLDTEGDIDLKEIYSMQIFNDYSEEIFFQISSNAPQIHQFLAKHSITSFLRAKMVDWMIQVLSSYKMSEQSFFRSVSLMDQYFQKEQLKLETKDIHLLGITCMFMAMKYEQVHPLRLSLISQKIGRNKFSREQIMRKQSKIIETLNFNLNFPTVYEVVSFLNYSIIFPEKQNSAHFLQKVLLYFSKMSQFKPEIASISIDGLGSAIYYAGLKVLAEQRAFNLIPELYLIEITRITGIQSSQIKQGAKIILEMAKMFSKEFPSVINLKKFNAIQ